MSEAELNEHPLLFYFCQRLENSFFFPCRTNLQSVGKYFFLSTFSKISSRVDLKRRIPQRRFFFYPASLDQEHSQIDLLATLDTAATFALKCTVSAEASDRKSMYFFSTGKEVNLFPRSFRNQDGLPIAPPKLLRLKLYRLWQCKDEK